MKLRDSIKPEQSGSGGWLAVIPLAPLIVAAMSDVMLQPGFSLFPFACSLGMLAMAFLSTSRQTLFWSVVYTFATLCALWLQRDLWAEAKGNLPALVAIRTAVTAIVGILAFSIAYHREKADRLLSEICRIFDQVKSPIVISDCNGWIKYGNPATDNLFSGALALDRPYFELFSEKSGKGVEVQRYVDIVTGMIPEPVVIRYSCKTGGRGSFAASMDRLVIGRKSFLITIVIPDEIAALDD